MAEAEYKSAVEIEAHPYLTNKKIGIRLRGLRMNTKNELLVPFRSTDGTLHTLQRITSAGEKRWYKGAAKKGYFKIPGKTDTLYLAEGLATALSIREATGNYSVMAGDKGCLFTVARTLRAALPDQRIVIAADTDALDSLMPLPQELGAEIIAPTGITGSDFNDLHQEKGLAEVKKQLSGTHSLEIVTPEPLRRLALSSNPFPVGALGPVLSPAAVRIQQIIQAPLAMCGQSVLAGAAQAIQGQLDIVIDGRRRPSSEFFISVGGTGERKSAVDEAALMPHHLYERELSEEYNLDLEMYRDDVACWKLDRKAVLKDLEGEDRRKAIEKIGPEPEKPLLPHLFSSDPTVPGIAKLLNLGRGSIGVFSDEGGLMIGGYSFNKEQAINTGAAFSKLWDGRPLDRVRGGDEIIKLHDRRISFHLMIQPKIAMEFLRHEGLADQGFLTRCLASYPKSTIGNRPYQEISLSDPKLTSYHSRMLEILKQPLSLLDGKR